MASSDRASPHEYRFDDLTLDAWRRRVLRGSDSLPLSGLTFELLRVLVEAAPRVVSHDELTEKAWGPRRVVTPENLSQRIMVLRNALGDSADQPRYIEGVRGRGYRLIPEVRANIAGLDGRMSSGESMMPAQPYVRERARSLAAVKVIYPVAGAFLLAAAFIAGNSYLRGPAIHDVASASSASAASDQPISFVVHAPEGSTFGVAPAAPDPALSPDGRKLAFVAPFDSNRVLWIQTVGHPDDARPIVGTNGADYPFWSPDGRYIAFGAKGRLKRIAATAEGLPRDVAGDPLWGGTWSAGGTIVFAGAEGLYAVSADGGDVRPLTRIDGTRGEFSHRFPVMLPDDTRYVYLVLSTQAEYTGLYLGSIDDPDMKMRLTSGDSNAAFGFDSTGRLHLIFVRDSSLVAQPFDASRGALTGDTVVIAREKIGTAPTVRYAAFAASGRALVYRPRFTPRAQLAWFDRRGIPGQRIGEDGGRWRFPSLSPDGTRLVALREDRSDAAGLWLFDLARDRRERLAPGGWVNEPSGGALMSVWARDGNQVVYSWQEPDQWKLHRRALTGADEVLFAGTTPRVKRIRDVTDDAALVHTDEGEFWMIPFAGQPYRFPIADGNNHARVSPDGRWLAYDSTEASVTQVYVTAFPVPAERWLVSTGGGSDPQWRRDGRELYYIAPDRTLMAVSVETATTFTPALRNHYSGHHSIPLLSRSDPPMHRRPTGSGFWWRRS